MTKHHKNTLAMLGKQHAANHAPFKRTYIVTVSTALMSCCLVVLRQRFIDVFAANIRRHWSGDQRTMVRVGPVEFVFSHV